MLTNLLNVTNKDIGNFGNEYNVKRMFFSAADLYPILIVENHRDWHNEKLINTKVIEFIETIKSYIEDINLKDVTDILIDIEPTWVRFFIDVINGYEDIGKMFNIHIPVFNIHKTVIVDMVCLNNKT